MAQKKYKEITCIQIDISYYGKCFSKVKYFTAKEDGVNYSSLREEDGLWFGIDLEDAFPINVHLSFFNRKWNTNCEYFERNANGGWNHVFDSAIFCKNIKMQYAH